MGFIPSMLAMLHFLLLLQVNAIRNQRHTIKLGCVIYPTRQPTSWSSQSGLFAFGFYRQGNGFAVGVWLVTQPENIVVWTANRDDPPVSSNASLELTFGGKLVFTAEQGEQKNIPAVEDSYSRFGYSYVQRADSASMLDSGNFVLWNNNSVIWQSFDYPTDTLLGGQLLTSNSIEFVSSKSRLDHSSGRFLIEKKSDGNLVAYLRSSPQTTDDIYWASDTPGEEIYQLSLDYGGQLCLNRDEGLEGPCFHKLAQSSVVGDKVIYRATLDTDGIFRLYSHRFGNNSTSSSVHIDWSTLNDRCDVYGSCGFNSYCLSDGSRVNCSCFHGFSPGNTSDDKLFTCFENVAHDCGKDLKVHFKMEAMENMQWGGRPYSVLRMIKEDCKRSCQEDCNCGAVLHENQRCKMYSLPLRYGKRNFSFSGTAFFKDNPPISHPPISQKYIVVRENDRLIRILAISLGSIAGFCSILAVTSFLIYRHRVDSYRRLSEEGNLGLTDDFTLRFYSYIELEKATNGFSELLGRGTFGAFYKGLLLDGNKTIAVKRLEKDIEDGEREFRAEIASIGRTNHRNLVRLLGFCVEGSRKLLVYEYMSNGSLADFLFKSARRPIWKERVRVALDVARGILYLHEECEIHIIHCNLKPQNILLDESWTAKISDFGLAKMLIPNQTTTAKSVHGTSGYSAPEWQKNSLISEKADIYSFGIVLLEIICCRNRIEVNVSNADEILLSSWVYSCLVAGELERILEGEEVEMKKLERIAKVGLWCTQDNPELRPSIKNVMLMLEGTMDVPMPPSPTLPQPCNKLA